MNNKHTFIRLIPFSSIKEKNDHSKLKKKNLSHKAQFPQLDA